MSLKHIISLIILIVIVGIAGYFTLMNDIDLFDPEETGTTVVQEIYKNTKPTNHSTEPISQCLTFCESDLDYPCCPDDFEEDCIEKGGVFRWTDMHPGGDFMHECFQEASDSGKACASAKECISGVCDLERALNAGMCALREKKIIKVKEVYSGEEFFTATYDCNTPTPGICEAARRNRENPGGKLHFFEMNGTTLTETLTSGPIH